MRAHTHTHTHREREGGGEKLIVELRLNLERFNGDSARLQCGVLQYSRNGSWNLSFIYFLVWHKFVRWH